MTDRIAPALTPEEWAASVAHPELPEAYVAAVAPIFHTDGRPFTVTEHRHAFAALALHGQPFGFTRAHAQTLREVARRLDADGLMYEDVDEVAALIEALLPPEKP